MVPQEKTYLVASGEDIDSQSSPIAMLLQGVHDRKAKRNDPSKLPGGKTVIKLVNDALAEEKEGTSLYKCVVVIEIGLDREYPVPNPYREGKTKGATCLKVMLIWNVSSYTQRRKAFSDKRKAKYEANKKPTKTMAEYEQEQAAAAAARYVVKDKEGFQAVKPRRRPRKPVVEE
jgi:hypothetical protein